MKLAHVLGIGLPLTFEGRQLWLRPLTWHRLGLLEAMLAGEALERVERSGRHAAIERVAALIERGEFDHDGKAASKALRSGRGFTLLVWLLLGGAPGQVEPSLELAELLAAGKPAEVLTRLRLLNPPGRTRSHQAKSPPFRTVAAVLAGEPHCLTLEEIGSLTPWQTAEVLFHDRDKDGSIKVPAECQGDSNQQRVDGLLDVFRTRARKQGWSPEETDRQWRQTMNRMAGIKPRK